MGAGQHGAEHHRAEDAADRIDQRPFPCQHPLQALGRPDEPQQRADHRGPGHHEDRADHQRGLGGHAQQETGEHGAERPGDRYPHDDQTADHPAGVPAQLRLLQRQAGVIQDHRHGQRHQRLEGRAEQPLGVDVAGGRARDEARRQQDDQRRDAQPVGQHLRADGQHEDEAHPEQDLVSGHCAAPTWNRLPISVLIRPRVHHWSPAKPCASGPFLSSCSSRAVGAENLRHQAIFVDHAPCAVAPLDPELIQIRDAVGQRP